MTRDITKAIAGHHRRRNLPSCAPPPAAQPQDFGEMVEKVTTSKDQAVNPPPLTWVPEVAYPQVSSGSGVTMDVYGYTTGDTSFSIPPGTSLKDALTALWQGESGVAAAKAAAAATEDFSAAMQKALAAVDPIAEGALTTEDMAGIVKLCEAQAWRYAGEWLDGSLYQTDDVVTTERTAWRARTHTFSDPRASHSHAFCSPSTCPTWERVYN